MTLNADKCHLLFSGHKEKVVYAKIGDKLVWEDCVTKLLGTFIDFNLSFTKPH